MQRIPRKHSTSSRNAEERLRLEGVGFRRSNSSATKVPSIFLLSSKLPERIEEDPFEDIHLSPERRILKDVNSAGWKVDGSGRNHAQSLVDSYIDRPVLDNARFRDSTAWWAMQRMRKRSRNRSRGKSFSSLSEVSLVYINTKLHNPVLLCWGVQESRQLRNSSQVCTEIYVFTQPAVSPAASPKFRPPHKILNLVRVTTGTHISTCFAGCQNL